VALERALPMDWIDEIFGASRQPQYPRDLFSLRAHLGAAMPGHTQLVFALDGALATDILFCEDAHESEHVWAAALLRDAKPRQL